MERSRQAENGMRTDGCDLINADARKTMLFGIDVRWGDSPISELRINVRMGLRRLRSSRFRPIELFAAAG
jgi:hypothetical protein